MPTSRWVSTMSKPAFLSRLAMALASLDGLGSFATCSYEEMPSTSATRLSANADVAENCVAASIVHTTRKDRSAASKINSSNEFSEKLVWGAVYHTGRGPEKRRNVAKNSVAV